MPGRHQEVVPVTEATSLFGENLESFQSTSQPPAESINPHAAKRLKPVNRSQVYWGQIDVERLIADDHPARGIWAMVNRLDLSALEAKIKAVQGRAGQSSIDPRLLMSLWIYGYSEGI